MDESLALSRLGAMCAATEEPVLTHGDLELLVSLAKRADASGLVSTDDGWSPTYDLAAAAAEGWRWKAARVAHRFTFSKDGQSFDVGALRESFLAMAAQYSRQSLGTIRLGGLPDLECVLGVDEYPWDVPTS